MDILLVGVNHRTADIEIREQLAFTPEQARATALELIHKGSFREAVILSTCNRTEFVGVAANSDAGAEEVYEAISRQRELPATMLRHHSYAYRSLDAVRHIFRVSSSLDSMVVGEPQILRQMKDAYQNAADGEATGPVLNKLFHRAFSVGKRVRTETAIAENAVSIGYAAVELAREIFNDLSERTALLIGAGEMAELTARHLLSTGLRNITVANRSLSNAVKLAEEFRGQAAELTDIRQHLVTADVVIASAASPDILIDHALMEEVARARRYRPVFLIDIALPRNIDADVSRVEGCYVYDIDDLDRVVARNLQNRHLEAQKAEQIVAEEVEKFPLYLKSLRVVPTIRQLQNKYDAIRRAEIERVMGRQPNLPPELAEKIDYLTQSLLKKFLHEPITVLKKEEAGFTDGLAASVVQQIFGLTIEDTANPVMAKRDSDNSEGS
ncbi:MAG: glutamyl-tRNA reductase [Deltaproteobacteria bacterium]|nr:glutamyl-tRNA reductase [Deltaproteobacteria bacterium]